MLESHRSATEVEPVTVLARHAGDDWGDIDLDDRLVEETPTYVAQKREASEGAEC